MLYKLNNGFPVPFTGTYVRHGGRIYANPTNEQLKAVGYKPLIGAERPEDEDGYTWVSRYAENEDSITQEWVKEVIEDWTAQY